MDKQWTSNKIDPRSATHSMLRKMLDIANWKITIAIIKLNDTSIKESVFDFFS